MLIEVTSSFPGKLTSNVTSFSQGPEEPLLKYWDLLLLIVIGAISTSSRLTPQTGHVLSMYQISTQGGLTLMGYSQT